MNLQNHVILFPNPKTHLPIKLSTESISHKLSKRSLFYFAGITENFIYRKHSAISADILVLQTLILFDSE